MNTTQTASVPSTPSSLQQVLVEVEGFLSLETGWCSMEKASSLIALIYALRPRVVVELGVWRGGSAIPMAIALKALGAGQLVAIDAWSTEMSVAGQELEANREWWSSIGESGHLSAFQVFMDRLRKFRIFPETCVVRRQRTDEAEIPASIDILHHDANHGPQAVEDIARWAPAVRVGGILILDDLNWAGGHVLKARDLALELGFVEMYLLGTGCVMQRLGLDKVVVEDKPVIDEETVNPSGKDPGASRTSDETVSGTDFEAVPGEVTGSAGAPKAATGSAGVPRTRLLAGIE